MSTLEQLAKVDSPRLPETVERALNAGQFSIDQLRKLLRERGRIHKADGETPQQSFAKSFSGQQPRDPIGAQLFATLVNLEKANDTKMHFASGGKPADDDEVKEGDNLESLVRAYMKDHPEITSKTRAVEAVLASPQGRAIRAREKQRAGVA